MKFKVVKVYSGYNEMSIISDVVINWRDNNIENLINELFKGLRIKFCDNGKTDFWNEFSDKGVISEDIGFYSCDEEGFNLVISENDNWYNRLSNHENWTDVEYNEWQEFCGGIA